MIKQTISRIGLIFFLFLSCSTFNVEDEIYLGSKVSKIKKAGLIIRLSSNSILNLDEHHVSISNWISGYKPLKEISVLKEISNNINYYSDENQRFFQLSMEAGVFGNNARFLKYKSLGVINQYLIKNSEELKKVIAENGYDGLIIYEVYSIISAEMQFHDFDSVLIVVDNQLNILYMDHQSNGYDTIEIDSKRIKLELLNNISERLIEILTDMDFIKEI